MSFSTSISGNSKNAVENNLLRKANAQFEIRTGSSLILALIHQTQIFNSYCKCFRPYYFLKVSCKGAQLRLI